MFGKSTMTRLRALTALAILVALFFGIADFGIADSQSRLSKNGVARSALNADPADSGKYFSSYWEQAMLCGIVPLKNISVTEYEDIAVYPGGMTFGVKLFTQGVMIVGFSEIDVSSGSPTPAYDAGLRANDVIIKINGSEIHSTEEFTCHVTDSKGAPLTVTYLRAGSEHTLSMTPSLSTSEGVFKTGLWLRDSTSGIGTVTFIDPESGAFGGLGHGVCDSDTGEILPLSKGYVIDVTISGIVKGKAGSPGELKGYLDSGKAGTLIKNCEYGVYGVFSNISEYAGSCEPIHLGLKSELKEGPACILASFGEGEPKKYEVRISRIDPSGNGNKNFVVTVTDPELLEKTGGIIQGMSGSPIIQGGKLVGAVTHVLINDPTTGYGIFIENMIAAMPDELG